MITLAFWESGSAKIWPTNLSRSSFSQKPGQVGESKAGAPGGRRLVGRNKDVVLVRVGASLDQRGPVHHLEVDLEADRLELLLQRQRPVVVVEVLLGGHPNRRAVVAAILDQRLGLVRVRLVVDIFALVVVPGRSPVPPCSGPRR